VKRLGLGGGRVHEIATTDVERIPAIAATTSGHHRYLTTAAFERLFDTETDPSACGGSNLYAIEGDVDSVLLDVRDQTDHDDVR
jgi:hypothetical protein